MSRFRKVEAGTWGDLRFRDLSENGKLLWFYLLTGPNVTSLPGVLRVSRASIMDEMHWSSRRLEKAFAEFARTDEKHTLPMAIADWKARLVWLPNAPKHNRPTNEFMVRSWSGHWSCLPECPLRDQIAAHIRGFATVWGDKFLRAFNDFAVETLPSPTVSQPESNPIVQRPPITPTSNPPVQSSPAPAPAPAPALSASVAMPPSQERVVDVGSARCEGVCETFVATLAEAGWPRAVVREPWERRALCDAINAHLRADGSIDGILAELRRAIFAWVETYRDSPRFTSGWGARKFGDWLAEGRESAQHSPAVTTPAESATRSRWADESVTPERTYTPAEIAAIDAQVEATVERLKNAHLEPAPRRERPLILGMSQHEQSSDEREAERKRQVAALAAITDPSRVA